MRIRYRDIKHLSEQIQAIFLKHFGFYGFAESHKQITDLLPPKSKLEYAIDKKLSAHICNTKQGKLVDEWIVKKGSVCKHNRY